MEKLERMQSIIAAYQKSGMRQKQFASSIGLKLDILKYWIKKLRSKDSSKGAFIKIETQAKSQPVEGLEIYYPNGVKVKVHKLDFAFLSQLIRVY